MVKISINGCYLCQINLTLFPLLISLKLMALYHQEKV